MRIKPESRACTAFISPFGPFQYIRMPFGLANTGSVYSRMLDVAMKKVDRDFWTSYLDDILTFSGEPWAHFRHLTQVVSAHDAAGSKIKPCKTKLAKEEFLYSGNTYRRSQIGLYQRQEKK